MGSVHPQPVDTGKGTLRVRRIRRRRSKEGEARVSRVGGGTDITMIQTGGIMFKFKGLCFNGNTTTHTEIEIGD